MKPDSLDVAVQGSISYGGVSRVTIELSKALAKKVNSVTVFPTPNSVDNPTEHEWWGKKPNNLTVKDTPFFLKAFARDIISFQKYDIVHVNYGTFGISAVFSSLFFDVPFVYTVHGSLEKDFKKKGWTSWISDELIERRIALPITAKFGDVVTVSEYSKTVLEDYISSYISVIYHGINQQQIVTSNIRERLGLGEAKICLCVSRFYPSKNIDLVVKAASLVQQNYADDIQFVLVGGGAGFDRISELVKDLSANNVQLLEDISDEELNELYSMSDLFILPSTTETFGIVFLESMAAGTPVIYANAGAAPEIVGDAGICLESNNPDVLSAAIEEILSNDSEYQQLVKRSKERAREFTWEKAADQYINHYMKLLE